MTVREVIEHLKTFPPDMEVWRSSSETEEGNYLPVKQPPARINHIVWFAGWWQAEKGRGKAICILEEPI